MKELLVVLSLIVGGISYSDVVSEARTYLGTPFTWEGRSEKGLDCLGLVFLPYSEVTGQNWKKYPVCAWEMIKQETFGKPIPGLNGVLSDSINYELFKTGDVIHILSDVKCSVFWQKICSIDTILYYAHHTGIFTENGSWIHANPYFEPYEVIEQSLKDFLKISGFPAIFVTRP